MDELKELMQIDWWSIIFALCVLLVCIKFVWSLIDWLFVQKLGIETKKMKQKREESELINNTATGLCALKEKHEKDELELKDCLISFMEETRNALKIQDENNYAHWETSKQIRKELTDTIKELADENQRKSEQIDSLVVANKEMLAEKINQKYKYYVSIGGIPEDEYDEFVSMHKAYKGVGGNHHGDAKYQYCIDHLPLISVETKLVYKDE